MFNTLTTSDGAVLDSVAADATANVIVPWVHVQFLIRRATDFG